MFTFGRDHEKKCEERLVRNPAQIPLLMGVIDAVHDLIEGRGNLAHVTDSVRTAFISGGAGVWENAAKWLRKTSFEYPEILNLWSELASHPKADVRFRVACLLGEMPTETFAEISPRLLADRSRKVADMAAYKGATVHGAGAA